MTNREPCFMAYKTMLVDIAQKWVDAAVTLEQCSMCPDEDRIPPLAEALDEAKQLFIDWAANVEREYIKYKEIADRYEEEASKSPNSLTIEELAEHQAHCNMPLTKEQPNCSHTHY